MKSVQKVRGIDELVAVVAEGGDVNDPGPTVVSISSLWNKKVIRARWPITHLEPDIVADGTVVRDICALKRLVRKLLGGGEKNQVVVRMRDGHCEFSLLWECKKSTNRPWPGSG
jgi:hypothetical protein